jgi:hypothetical protein
MAPSCFTSTPAAAAAANAWTTDKPTTTVACVTLATPREMP